MQLNTAIKYSHIVICFQHLSAPLLTNKPFYLHQKSDWTSQELSLHIHRTCLLMIQFHVKKTNSLSFQSFRFLTQYCVYPHDTIHIFRNYWISYKIFILTIVLLHLQAFFQLCKDIATTCHDASCHIQYLSALSHMHTVGRQSDTK